MHHEPSSRSCSIFSQCQLFHASLTIKIKQLYSEVPVDTQPLNRSVSMQMCALHTCLKGFYPCRVASINGHLNWHLSNTKTIFQHILPL